MHMGILVITAAMAYSTQNWTLGYGIPEYPHRKAWVDSNWYLFPYYRATPRHMAGTRWGLSHPLLLRLFSLTKREEFSSDVPSKEILQSTISQSKLRLNAAFFLVHMQWRSCGRNWEPTLPPTLLPSLDMEQVLDTLLGSDTCQKKLAEIISQCVRWAGRPDRHIACMYECIVMFFFFHEKFTLTYSAAMDT